jgi:NAD+ diphosphatase
MRTRWPLVDSPRVDRNANARASVDLDAADAIIVSRGGVLVDANRLAIVPAGDRPAAREVFYLGRVGGRDVVGLVPDDASAPERVEFTPLRRAYVTFEGDDVATDRELASTAVAMATWHERAARCPLCGSPTESASGGWVRRCVEDGVEHYPRTDPAVIVRITDPDDRLLLAHVSYHSPGRYSHLAGYVEPGESLEQAAHREVREEAAIEIADLAYVGSQPWPFPASVMVGFSARADSARFEVDGEEVVEAAWFTREELAARVAEGAVILAPPDSIARFLVHDWYGGAIPDAADVTSA